MMQKKEALKSFKSWAKSEEFSLKYLFPSVSKNEVIHIDLSINNTHVKTIKEFNNLPYFETKLEEIQTENPTKIIAGGYLEKRALYTSDIYKRNTKNGVEKRDTHLGVDFWLPAQTPVNALLDGEIVCITDDNFDKGYGGLLILKHKTKNNVFFTLYGHLSLASIEQHKVGNIIRKGAQIGQLGNATENGNWVPHLHFQIMLTLLDFKNDFPGVAYESEIEFWKSICPNPNLLFKLKALDI